jgi:hypothetical protein
MKCFVHVTGLFSVLLAVSPASAAIIDDFEDGAFSLTSTSPNGNCGAGNSQSDLAGVIGGARGASVLLWDQGHTSGSAIFSLDLSSPGDHAVVLSIPAGRTATAGCLYPASSQQEHEINLIADGANAVQFTFSQDPGNGSLDFSVFTDSDHWASIALTGAAVYQIPYSAFGLSNDELVHVTQLYVDVICTAGNQPITAALSDVRTVPEPSTLALFGVGMAALVSLRMARAKSGRR